MVRFSLAAFFAVFFVAQTLAAEPMDPGPPYSDTQFLALSETRLPVTFRSELPSWWQRAPDYLRHHVLSSPSHMWWPIILCNFLGFRPDSNGPDNSKKCEEDAYTSSQRGRNSWTADGQWVGPSEECRKRDKRSKYGELICD